MVSAVSSISGYSSSSTQQIDPSIKAMLDKLGLTSTGSQDKDIAAIKAAVAAQNSQQSDSTDSTAQSSSEQKHSGTPPTSPYASLMSELGISSTGSMDGDVSAISSKISELSSSATTEEDKVKAASYQTQFANIQSQASNPPFSTAQNQTASLNKFFMLGQS